MPAFKNVSLDTIGQWLNLFFGDNNNNASRFSPDDLYTRAIANGVNIATSPIALWSDFEYGYLEWDVEDFKSIIWNSEGPLLQGSSLFFISDETLMNKAGFELCLNDFEKFADYYEDNFNMSFFQPADYIICMKEEKQIRIIHHEGVRIAIEKSWKSF
jgi:hypothetical protein